MQPILKYSKNNMWFFLNGSKSCATAKLAYVINQWPNPFGSISNPLAFGVVYIIKYSSCFRYFISYNIKIGLKMWQHYATWISILHNIFSIPSCSECQIVSLYSWNHVIQSSFEQDTVHKPTFFGSARHHTVYEGELVGMGLGVELLRKERNVRLATLYIDNQASIQSTNLHRAALGHYLIDHVHSQMEQIFQRTPKLHFAIWWIPGHKWIQGNEVADNAAKEAAQTSSSHNVVLPACFKKRSQWSEFWIQCLLLPHSDNQDPKPSEEETWMQLRRRGKIAMIAKWVHRQSIFL